jgi:YHS domain-containing protein
MGSFLLDILEFVILLLFLKAMVQRIGSLFRSPHIHVKTAGAGRSTSSSPTSHRGEMVRDPVCGMFVSTELSHQLGRGGDTLHFCSRECLEKYQKQKDREHAAS